MEANQSQRFTLMFCCLPSPLAQAASPPTGQWKILHQHVWSRLVTWSHTNRTKHLIQLERDHDREEEVEYSQARVFKFISDKWFAAQFLEYCTFVQTFSFSRSNFRITDLSLVVLLCDSCQKRSISDMVRQYKDKC